MANPNDGTVKAENSEWSFEWLVRKGFSRVNFDYAGAQIFCFIRWGEGYREVEDNSIGFHVARDNYATTSADHALWTQKSIPGELLAKAMYILYSREWDAGQPN